MRREWIAAALAALLLGGCAAKAPPEVAKVDVLPEPAAMTEVNVTVYGALEYRFVNFDNRPALPEPELWPTVYTKEGLYGFLDADGEVLIEAKYERVHEFQEGIAVVREEGAEGKWSWVTYNVFGERLLFDSVWRFHRHDIALVQQEHLYGYINIHGEPVIPLVYEAVFEDIDMDGRYVWARREGVHVVLDLQEGRELRFEPYTEERAEQFDRVVELPGDRLCLINGRLAILGEVEPFERGVWELLLDQTELDLYLENQFSGTHLLQLRAEMYWGARYLMEGVSDELLWDGTFAVLTGAGVPVPELAPVEPEAYRITLECFALEQSLVGRELKISAGYAGRIFPGGPISAVLEVNEVYPEGFMLPIAAPPINNGANAILLVPDVAHPEQYRLLTGLDPHTGTRLIGLFDLNGDGSAELMLENAFYEGGKLEIISLEK